MLATALAWVTALLVWAETPAAQHLSNLGLAGAALLAGGTAWLRARRHAGSIGRFWRLLGLASLSWAAGQFAWTWFESVQGERRCRSRRWPMRIPGPAPVRGGGPAVVAAGRTQLGRSRAYDPGRVDGRGLHAAVQLDLGAGPGVPGGGDTLLVQLISLAYPIGDVIVITLVLYTWLRARHLHRKLPVSLPLVGSGLLAFAVADSGFTYLTTIGAYSSGSLIDIGWFAGFVLLLDGGHLARARGRQHRAGGGPAAGQPVALRRGLGGPAHLGGRARTDRADRPPRPGSAA